MAVRMNRRQRSPRDIERKGKVGVRGAACILAVVWLLAGPAGGRSGLAGPTKAYGKIELVRDTWGIPHIFSDTDAGAMYGLGYAAAEERAFQMYYGLRIIQGRLAELIGDVERSGRRETAVQHDRKMRTFGFYRAAKRVAGNLDAETLALLRAYSEGVNDYIAARGEGRHPLFQKLGLQPEPWTPADCIASAWRLGQFFATDGTRDLMQYRTLTGQGRSRTPSPPRPGPLWKDDASAVVQRPDVTDEWVQRTEEFLRRHGLTPGQQPQSRPIGPRFSHAWVVGGRKTTTGAAVLVSDPQTPVRNPSLWHEFHVCGKTFNARGVGVPGSPGILIGWTEHVAWGLTALGADQADLFRLKTDPDRPDQYWFDGKWRAMTVIRETILVKDARPVEIVVRETHFGPVVTEFAFAREGDPQVALKRVPVCEIDRESIQGLMGMVRARDVHDFARALGHWRFPSVNVVFGDRMGNIGYWLLAAIPIRSKFAADQGRAAMDGTDSRYDWQGMVPHHLLPHVINPQRGWIASANHRPIGSFYRIPLGLSTGSMGDTVRSWRLRERLEGADRFRPEEVVDIHYDTVNPAHREIVRVGYHLRDVLKRDLSAEARRALDYLAPWYAAGASSDLSVPGAEVAMGISTFFRFTATRLAGRYGGGESGLCRFLKAVGGRIAEDPKADIAPLEQEFIVNALATAWKSAQGRFGRDTAQWPAQARAQVRRRRLGYFDSLDGFGSLDTSGDLDFPGLTCVDGATIKSQAGQSYTQYVPLQEVDGALSLLPIGHSERADSRLRTSTYALWEAGRLHPAPLSRKAVEEISASAQVLSR